jgi:hypothetical protein
MTLHKYSWLIFVALSAASSLRAAEITGKVRDAGVDSATVVIDGEALPAVGDSAEIFFKLPGADEEISVASGKVAAVEAKVVKLKIEKTTGTIEKDQLARIKSGSTPTTAVASPTPAASPSTPAPTSPSIVGDWVGTAPDGSSVFFSLKADGTVRWGYEDANYAQSVSAKYRIDSSTQPQSIEMFDIEEGKGIDKGERAPGIFELQSDGRLKLEFSKRTEALKEFTKEAIVFSKATSPLVPSNKPPPPTPAPYVAPTPSPDEKLLEEGKDLFRRKDCDGAIKLYTKAIELNPKNANAFYWRAICYEDKKNEAAALADYEKAQELDPTMKLQSLIDAMKQLEKVDRELATATPTPANSTATPTRATTKRKP